MAASHVDRLEVRAAIETHTLWRVEDATSTGRWVSLVTDYDERLWIQYNNAGQIVSAQYSHWDENGRTVSEEVITKKKRERVLELITQPDVADAR